ncbi:MULTISPECIES: site-specific integrase [unclassified Bacillus (in: firmicutes)]|uniref:tyrosine-type recombinase/integrase n=1 Tax=unclassified Bacillus (in: firmicutes) TaxID=185979 RepID=UPI0013EEB580|nr:MULTISPECIES: site-specific integrase [unclassified Bacillus (in: firmicutes)]KAF6545588.1 tyrosine-type recombinase/integrase [Bacillus sp. EKM207B]KAF6546573.1 tyrosine-type recombinase/integrase [Bacillus sp. EKM206B]KAF6554881.1 tyrosine-type recombinase/integrase [Bacillus sp. EKM203B]MBL3611700.1 tyrosine-type recombinase/integrase [Bacillus sp. RHFS18]
MDRMGCKVLGTSTFKYVNPTYKSPKTVSTFLSAIKLFYTIMIQKKDYIYVNPLIDIYSKLEIEKSRYQGVRKDAPRLPHMAGTEEELSFRRETDSYFKFAKGAWAPEIIDDKFLPTLTYEAGKKHGWTLREIVIARLLYETGARISEIIGLTIGDYRSRSNINEANTFSKGSYGRRVKFIIFQQDTARLLMRYINKERKKYAVNKVKYEQLSDEEPLFISEKGTPLTYQAWYYHWNGAMAAVGIKLNPHKTRHWFTTARMRMIKELARNPDEYARMISEFRVYMKWKHEDTIRAYEHHFTNETNRVMQLDLHEKMKQDEAYYLKNRKEILRRNAETPHSSDSEPIVQDKEIQEFLDGLD